MMNLIKLVVVLSSAFLLIACSPPMPDKDLGSGRKTANKQHFKWEERKPLRKIKLAGGFFISKQLDSNLPEEIANTPIAIKFSGRVGTLGDITFMLEQKDIPVAYNWTVYEDVPVSSPQVSSSSDESMDFEESSFQAPRSSSTSGVVTAINTLENRSIPFKTYKGNIKGLLNRLRTSMNISYWWEDGSIFLSTKQEYVVSVPQQRDIIDSIASEIEALGATDISSSLTAGQIVYYAKPRAHSSLIKPFLKRISHNLSEITLQVALVQVEINENTSKGFDWDAFDINITSPLSGATNSNDVNIIPYNGDTSNPVGEIAGSFFRRGISIFGTKTDVDVDVAINILSTLGKTTTEQNVEMRTISGKEVTLESVNEESYVSGYSGGSYGDNPEPPSPEFDTVETGLILTFLPVFDAYNAIVTIDSSISLSSRGADTVVDAGGDFGEVSVRPNISKDSFEDIVRIPVGETVIVGGLMTEILIDNRTAPMGMWEVNSTKQQTRKQALFLIIRPLVTLYETEGNEMVINERELMENVKYNYDKAEEKKKEDKAKARELRKEKAKIDKETKRLAKEREAMERAEYDRLAEIEADRLAIEKMEAKKIAEEKAKVDRLSKMEADRLAKIEADEKVKEFKSIKSEIDSKTKELAKRREDKAKAELETKAKQEAEMKAKFEADLEKAKQEMEAKYQQDLSIKEEAKKIVEEKVESDRLVKMETNRLAKVEAEKKAESDRLVKMETNRLAKVEAEKKAKEFKSIKSEIDRKTRELTKKREAKAKAELEASAKQEAEMKAKFEADLEKAKQEMEVKHKQDLSIKEKEAEQLKVEMEDQKKAIEILEAESEWIKPSEQEKIEIVVKENIEQTIKEQVTVDEDSLSEEEARKIHMLNMLRGIKN